MPAMRSGGWARWLAWCLAASYLIAFAANLGMVVEAVTDPQRSGPAGLCGYLAVYSFPEGWELTGFGWSCLAGLSTTLLFLFLYPLLAVPLFLPVVLIAGLFAQVLLALVRRWRGGGERGEEHG